MMKALCGEGGGGDGRCSLEPNEPSLIVMTTRAQGADFVISGLKKKKLINAGRVTTIFVWQN